MENSKKNGYLCDCLLPWQQSAKYSYERKWNPSCVANLHCECQELKPKVETNTSFLVRHPFSGVDAVKTVGRDLKIKQQRPNVREWWKSIQGFFRLKFKGFVLATGN